MWDSHDDDMRTLAKYNAAHDRFQRAEIRKWKCIAGALVRQLEALEAFPAVPDIAMAAYPAELSIYRDPARCLTLLTSKGQSCL